MEHLSSNKKEQQVNCLCLICGSKNTCAAPTNKPGSKVTLLSKQLNTIFILKYILKLPITQLEEFLEKYGNPDDWIRLCKRCTQLTDKAYKLHFQMLQFSSQLKNLQNEIIEKTKQTVKYQQPNLEINWKMTVWKAIKELVKNDGLVNPIVPQLLEKQKLSGISTESPEVANYVPPPTLLSSPTSNDINEEGDNQQCPNCNFKFPTQQTFAADTDDTINPSSAFVGEAQKCLYCPIEYPSISSLFKHMQTEHDVDRLPCLHPGCGATLKNLKQFFKHRQRHRRKEAQAEQSCLFGDDNDNLQGSIQSEANENNMKVEVKCVKAEVKCSIEKSGDGGVENLESFTPEHLDDDNDTLQDNHNDDDNDDDWVPNSELVDQIDIKPTISSNYVDNEDNCSEPPESRGDDNTQEISLDNLKFPQERKYKTVHKPEVQKCPKCSTKFPSITSTLRHMLTFHKMKRLPCLHSGCQQTLKNLKQYFKHRSTHLRPPKPKIIRVRKKKVDGPQLCDICGASFPNNKGLHHHRSYVHGNKQRTKRIYKDVPCHMCGLVLKDCHLKMHLLRIHKDELGEDAGSVHKCMVMGCKRSFILKKSLDKHRDKIHGGWDGTGEPPKEMTFSCKFCGKGFYWKWRLEQHELAHQNNLEGVKPHICDLCGKGFAMPQNLSNHKKYTHKLAKKFLNTNS